MNQTNAVPTPAQADNRAGHTDPEKVRQRIRFIMLLLIEGRSLFYVRNFVRKNFGLKARQTETYIARARQLLLNEVEMPTRDLVAQSYGFYMNVLSQDGASVRDKLKARELADKLIGLQAQNRKSDEPSAADAARRSAFKDMTTDDLRRLVRSGQQRANEITATPQSN